jgi:3-hydroxyisobutyrate dehydrogenase
VKNVALLGLGTMGSGMAGCLQKAGFELTVWNRTTERAETFAKTGTRVAASPREAAREAEVLIAMLADDKASLAVWLGETGALHSAKPGAVVIDSSTLSPAFVRRLAHEAAQRGCAFLDAPVTGSRVQAATGDLKFLVGGDAETLHRVKPVLNAMGKDIVHFGPAGSGATMKLVNNFVCGVQAAALAEAVALIEKAGLDREAALSILLNGAPGSPLVKAVAPRMVSQDYSVYFALELMLKDLSYAIAEADQHGLRLRTAAAACQLLEQAIAKGFGRRDFSAVVEPLRTS